MCKPGNLHCLLTVHVDDIKGTAQKHVADPLLERSDRSVGQCNADGGSFLHSFIQHEQSPGVVSTHPHVCINSVTPTDGGLVTGNGDEEQCCVVLHEVSRWVFGVVVWTVLTRAELAAYVQALQRRAHAFRIHDCTRPNFAIRNMKRHKCGPISITSKH